MKKTGIVVRSSVALLLIAVAAPAWAWGPKAQQAIVTAAARLISKENNVPLVRLESYIQRGAAASAEEVAELVPQATSDPLRAIEAQMYLLQASRDAKRIDPYFAYRLGVLGKLVAEYTSPLADADPTYRDMYFADVEKNIGSVSLKIGPRRTVEPANYLPSARAEAQSRKDLILGDYQSGQGFTGVARGALSEEAGRSVAAVADIWYTLLQGSPTVGSVSDVQQREYHLQAMDFYLSRQTPNLQEVRRAYDRIEEMGEVTADLHKRIGDMYYDAGQFEQAVAEYKTVLELEPGRDDVAERISQYYAKLGDEAIVANRLEEGLEAYRQAQTANPTSLEAQTKLREAEAAIEQRNQRLEDARQAITEAQQLEQRADQAQLQRDFGGAIAALQQARSLYASVPEDFPAESQAAALGITNVDSRIRELQGQVVTSTEQLSGSGFSVVARRLAANAEGFENKALETILAEGYQQEVQELRRELDRQLAAPETETQP